MSPRTKVIQSLAINDNQGRLAQWQSGGFVVVYKDKAPLAALFVRIAEGFIRMRLALSYSARTHNPFPPDPGSNPGAAHIMLYNPCPS